MTILKTSLPASGTAPTLPLLAQALRAQALLGIEHALIDTLSILGRELFGAGLGMAPEQTVRPSDAAEREYASWAIPMRAAALSRHAAGNDSRTQAS